MKRAIASSAIILLSDRSRRRYASGRQGSGRRAHHQRPRAAPPGEGPRCHRSLSEGQRHRTDRPVPSASSVSLSPPSSIGADAEEHLIGFARHRAGPLGEEEPTYELRSTSPSTLARTSTSVRSPSPATPGAAIVISGKSVGTLPLAKPIRVNAGPALVTATAPGFKQFEMSIPVEAGSETPAQDRS